MKSSTKSITKNITKSIAKTVTSMARARMISRNDGIVSRPWTRSQHLWRCTFPRRD